MTSTALIAWQERRDEIARLIEARFDHLEAITPLAVKELSEPLIEDEKRTCEENWAAIEAIDGRLAELEAQQ